MPQLPRVALPLLLHCVDQWMYVYVRSVGEYVVCVFETLVVAFMSLNVRCVVEMVSRDNESVL